MTAVINMNPTQLATLPHMAQDLSSFGPPEIMAKPQSENVRMAFSVQETAILLGVSDKTVRRLISRKLLRPSRALRHHLIPKKEIERFLDETTLK